MSWISKALGLDKNKDLLKQINEVLANAAVPQLTAMKAKYLKLCIAKGVSEDAARTTWDTLLELVS